MTSQEKTFRTFTPEQAAQYASGRGQSYPEPLYQRIMDYHTGPHETVLDVGPGPGKVVFDLLEYFTRGIGCDTSPQMIEQAKKDAVKHGVAERSSFAVAGGKDCAKALTAAGVEQVDAITVAMAAHWLDMPAFCASAAKALRPGGTLALWTCSSLYCHPAVPNHGQIQAILDDLEDNLLLPYMAPGNLLSRGAYEQLPLPWPVPETRSLFTETSFQRTQWDLNGVPSAPPLADGRPGPFLFDEESTLEQAEAGWNSSSSVIRCREANPDKALTDEDPVKLTMKRLREIIGSSDCRLRLAPSCTLLLMRKA